MPTGATSSKKTATAASPSHAAAPPPTSATPSGGERGLAALAYWGPLVVVPLVVRKKGRFLSYHTRQGLYLFGTAVATVVLTLGLLFLFDQTMGRNSPPFLVLSVILLLEMIVYVVMVVSLTVASLRSRMPMLPLLGDLAGES